jgi:hypothetical protein
MWKNIIEPDRLQITIWRMRIACWIPKATDTRAECVILIGFFHCNSDCTQASDCSLNEHCLSSVSLLSFSSERKERRDYRAFCLCVPLWTVVSVDRFLRKVIRVVLVQRWDYVSENHNVELNSTEKIDLPIRIKILEICGRRSSNLWSAKLAIVKPNDDRCGSVNRGLPVWILFLWRSPGGCNVR